MKFRGKFKLRANSPAGGEIHFHLRSVTQNPALADAVRAQYSQPALVPASPWLDSIPPDKPKLTIGESCAGLRFQWEHFRRRTRMAVGLAISHE